jgi:hypothetical protein
MQIAFGLLPKYAQTAYRRCFDAVSFGTNHELLLFAFVTFRLIALFGEIFALQTFKPFFFRSSLEERVNIEFETV